MEAGQQLTAFLSQLHGTAYLQGYKKDKVFVLIFGRIMQADYLCRHHVKFKEAYQTHKETVPAKEGLKSVWYDRIYSRPFRNRKGFFNAVYQN